MLKDAEANLQNDDDPNKALYRNMLVRKPGVTQEEHDKRLLEIARINFIESDTLAVGNLQAHMLYEEPEDIMRAAREAPLHERPIVVDVAAAALQYKHPKIRNAHILSNNEKLQAAKDKLAMLTAEEAAAARARADGLRRAEIEQLRQSAAAKASASTSGGSERDGFPRGGARRGGGKRGGSQRGGGKARNRGSWRD